MTKSTTELQSTHDGTWLAQNRARFGLCQSDIAAYLTLVSRRAINQGRIAEVETGQRTMRTEWREMLETFFERVEVAYAQGKDWRSLFV